MYNGGLCPTQDGITKTCFENATLPFLTKIKHKFDFNIGITSMHVYRNIWGQRKTHRPLPRHF